MQQAAFADGPRLEIAKSPRRIAAGLLCLFLFVLLCGGGVMLGIGDERPKLLVISTLFTLACIPVSILLASQMLHVMRASNPALTFERDGLRLNFAGAFIPYSQIERVTGGDSRLLSTVGLRLAPGVTVPRLGFGMKWPGRNIPLVCLFTMPARQIIKELEQRITEAVKAQPIPGAPPRIVVPPTLFNMRLNRLSYWLALPGIVLLHVLLRDKGGAGSFPWFLVFAVTAGRLRDMDIKGRWALPVLLFPILVVVFRGQPVLAGGLAILMAAALFILGCWPGVRGDNRFGPPKACWAGNRSARRPLRTILRHNSATRHSPFPRPLRVRQWWKRCGAAMAASACAAATPPPSAPAIC